MDVLRRFDARAARFFVLEWHRRARKTTLALNVLIREACRLPRTAYTYVAPSYRQARDIVWDDPNMLDSYLPDKAEMGWEKNEQKLHVKFANGSLLRLRGADDFDTLRGGDTVGVVFDEWAMIDPGAWLEIYRPIIAQDVSRWAMFLFTPKGVNHATDMLDDAASGKSGPEWFGHTLRASTSGLISDVELEKARREMPPTLYDQELECSRITHEDRILITSRMLAGLANVIQPHEDLRGRRIVACDPAMGGDECVCQYIEAGNIIEQVILHDRDSMKVAGTLAILGQQHDCLDYVVDTIGNGKGVVDRLGELGKNVQAFNSAESANEPERFANRRIEAWWYLMEAIQNKRIMPLEDDLLRRQLSAVHWQPQNSSGRIILEPKDKTKKTLASSPDRADCYVMGLWGLRNVTSEGKRHKYGRELVMSNDWRTA